jgi:hypothetical protein
MSIKNVPGSNPFDQVAIDLRAVRVVASFAAQSHDPSPKFAGNNVLFGEQRVVRIQRIFGVRSQTKRAENLPRIIGRKSSEIEGEPRKYFLLGHPSNKTRITVGRVF